MNKRSFTDSDGDKYTVTKAITGNIVLHYENGESGESEMVIFKVEDAEHIATMILDAAKEHPA